MNVVHGFGLQGGFVVGRRGTVVWEEGDSDGYRCCGGVEGDWGKVGKVDGGGVFDLFKGTRGVEVTDRLA